MTKSCNCVSILRKGPSAQTCEAKLNRSCNTLNHKKINKNRLGPVPSLAVAAVIALAAHTAAGQAPVNGAADPIIKDSRHFDSRRPIERELQTDVPNGFTVGAVGDL